MQSDTFITSQCKLICALQYYIVFFVSYKGTQMNK